MPNYRETLIAGQAWTRAVRVVCDNPLDGMPTVNFVEERAARFDGQTLLQPAGNIIVDMSAPDTLFALLDPATGDPTGATATYRDVYAMLHSLYMHAAAIRDGA